MSYVTKYKNYLWIAGDKRLEDKKRVYPACIVDVKNPADPKLVWHHEFDFSVVGFQFYGDYGYSLEHKREENPKLIIFNFSHPTNPVEVKSLEIVPHTYGNMLITGDQMFIIGIDRGVIFESQIYRYSLANPETPKLISDGFTDITTGKEKKIFEGFFSNLSVNGDFLYARSNNEIVVFSFDSQILNLVTKQTVGLDYISNISVINDSIDPSSRFFYVSGHTQNILPIENPQSKDYYELQSGCIGLLSHMNNARYPAGISMTGLYQMPMGVSRIESGKTLAYIFGYDRPERDSGMNFKDYKAHVWVVNFQQTKKPRIVGKYQTISPGMDVLIDGNMAYMLKYDGNLELIELPVSNEEFYRTWGDPEEDPYNDLTAIKNPAEKGIDNYVRKEINKPSGELTSEDLKSITKLEIPGVHITNLKGIENCTNLKELSVGYNAIKDISQLSNLKELTSLNLQRNEIENFEPLRNLVNLEVLNIDENRKVKNIEPLKNLSSLRELDTRLRTESDVETVSNLVNLETLSISGTEIHNIDSISRLKKLKNLHIWAMDIQDFTPVSKLSNLENLSISNVLIKDFSGISLLKNLKELGMSSNSISDLSFLKDCGKLVKLDLSTNSISNLNSLKNHTNLVNLDLNYNRVEDTYPLADIKSLEVLELRSNLISDIESLAKFKGSLKKLYLDKNRISDISALAGLEKIERLGLSDNKITDVSCFKDAKMDSLTSIALDNNQITDISGLSSLRNLKSLNLSGNQIADISPIVQLTSLKSVHVSSNKITDITPLLKSDKRPDNCILYLQDNPIDSKVLADNRITLAKIGWLIGPDSDESLSIGNMTAAVEMSQAVKQSNPDGNYGSFDDIKAQGYWNAEIDMSRLFPKYEIALFEVTPSQKLADGTTKESTLKIIIKPKKSEEGLRIFAITGDMIPREYIGDTEITDFTNLNLDDENLWKKWTNIGVGGIVESCFGGG
jgi:Leucine-rich repeat (LRR) protein